MTIAAFWNEPLPSDLHFPNAPGCRTRAEAVRLYLSTHHFAESVPSPASQQIRVLHTNYHPHSDNSVIDRQTVDLGNGRVRKSVRISSSDLRSEADTLAHIGKVTSVPVPRVFEVSLSQEFEHLVMGKMPGRTLDEAMPDLSDQELETLADQIMAFVHEWRKLQSPTIRAKMPLRKALPDEIQDLGSFYDFRFRPYADIAGVRGYVQERIATFLGLPMVFTHGDLDPSNIMVDNKTVSGLIDFELSGHLPVFWEWLTIRIHHMIQPYNRWFQILLRRLEPTVGTASQQIWEVEQLRMSLDRLYSPQFLPADRDEQSSHVWEKVSTILGIGDTPRPDITYGSITRHLFWAERISTPCEI